MAKAMRCTSEPRYIHSGMGYPYFIKRSGEYGSYRDVLPVVPSCPMLFIYGQKKPFMFHTQTWLEQIASKPGSQVIAMASDHWPMRTQTAAFNQAVLEWLARN